jgi:hypothetical protein
MRQGRARLAVYGDLMVADGREGQGRWRRGGARLAGRRSDHQTITVGYPQHPTLKWYFFPRDRLRRRFAIGRNCVVADRGMISTETVAALEQRKLLYLLGTRERTDKVVRAVVLADSVPCGPLTITKRGHEIDYEAKAVTVGGRRYVLCRNHQEAERDAATRQARRSWRRGWSGGADSP